MATLPAYYAPPPTTAASASRPTATSLNRTSGKQVDVKWSQTCFGKSFRLVYGRQQLSGWVMTRPVVNTAGRLVVAVYWCIGPIADFLVFRINGRAIPTSVIATHYNGSQVGVIDPTLADAIPSFSDTYDGVAYSVFEIPAGTVEGFPSQSQFFCELEGKVVDENISPSSRYWRIRPTVLSGVQNRPMVAEVELRSVIGGPNVAVGGTPIASSGTPANAFDGVPVTVWDAAGGDVIPNSWIGYDAGPGNSFTVNQVLIRAGGVGQTARAPLAFILEYSSDGVSWQELMSKENLTPWSNGQSRVFSNYGLTSDNPARQLVDFIEDSEYGLGAPVIGATEAIEFDDELVGDFPGEPRARAGFTLFNSRASEIIDLIAVHAELIWSYDGEGVLLVPDARVEDPDLFISADNIEFGSLTIKGNGIIDSPSVMSVTFTDRNTTDYQWSQDTQTVSRISKTEAQSVVMLPGIYRRSEAFRKARARLVRLSASAFFEWTHTDEGIELQVGTVVRLPNIRGLVNQDARVLSITSEKAGAYRIRAERYTDEMYPDAREDEGNGTAPVGLIIPFSGSAIPTGWAEFTDANDNFIIFAGDEYDVGDTGGSATLSAFSGDTEFAGEHTGPDFNVYHREPGTNTSVSTRPRTDVPQGGHLHTFSTTSTSPDLYRRESVLVIKTGSESDTIPPSCQIFGRPGIYGGGVELISDYNGRLLKAASSSANAGTTADVVLPLTISTVSDSHMHDGPITPGIESGFLAVADTHTAGGPHNHAGSKATVRYNLKRKQVNLYGATEEYPIRPGFIGLYEDIGSIPVDWYLCDGTNGTIDLLNYFLQFAGVYPEDGTGDNTVSISGRTPEQGHAHSKGTTVPGGNGFAGYTRHTGTVYHSHGVDASQPWMPPYYALLPIMYLPEIE